MRVGVVGSSARAAVHSLARAGIAAWAIDQFCDRDLRRVAECAVCPPDGYPHVIPDLAKRFPPGPVLYTGGLENHPHVVAELAKSRQLWGNPLEVLARVRDPFGLFPVLERAGFRAPRLVPHGESCPRDGCWLRKPFASGGGIGIRSAEPGEPASATHYFQEWIDGTPMSAVFANDALLGVTEQLIGESWLHSHGFAYCGNIVHPAPASTVGLLSDLMCERGLRGVWGCDFVLRDGVPAVLEVNPRYTAATELLEYASGTASLSIGGQRRWEVGGSPIRQASEQPRPVGKAIYYSPRALTFPRSGPWDAELEVAFDPWRLPTYADIPDPGSAIQPGWPVLTVFATGSTSHEVRERLQSRAAELDRLFAEQHP